MRPILAGGPREIHRAKIGGMVASPFEGALARSRTSLDHQLERWRTKRWQIAQCAVAAGVAWFVAKDLLGHTAPFFAPVAAVVSLGTSYGQRLRRAAAAALVGAPRGLSAALLVHVNSAGG